MAMFKWSTTYVNPADVVLISLRPTGNTKYPFGMTVRLRDGYEYTVQYNNEGAREDAAAQLAAQVNRLQPEPVTRNEIKFQMDRLKEALRRDIRDLRQEILKGE